MCWHVKSRFVFCVYALQSKQIGIGCVSGKILCKYSINRGHFFALSFARVLLVYLGSVCSRAFIFGGGVICYFVVCPYL